jgi:hypothetical protein
VQQARVDVVPRVVISGDGDKRGTGSSLMEGLLAILLSERMGAQLNAAQMNAPAKPEVEAIRDQIRRSLAAAIPSGDEPAQDAGATPMSATS